MIVELEAAAFTQDASLVDLAALIALCRGDPHAVLLDPPYDSATAPSLLAAFGTMQEEIGAILEYGPDAAALRPRRCPRIRVIARGPSDWSASPPRLSITDAATLLRRPLDVVVENRRNDGAFLRKVLPPDWRRAFDRWERDGYLRIDSEGGLGEMLKRVERAAGRPAEAARLWLLFDRDCRGEDPTKCDAIDDERKVLDALCLPSDDAATLAKRCRAVTAPWPLEFWMLERRAIENYLPLATLFGWAGADRDSRQMVEAFRDQSEVTQPGLSPETQRAARRARRYCFPMKKGLAGDVSDGRERDRLRDDGSAPIEDRHIRPLYRVLDADHRSRLRGGFGRRIAELFHDEDGIERVSEADLAREVGDAERFAIAESIARRI